MLKNKLFTNLLQKEKTGLLILLGLWAIVQALAFFQFEMRISCDTDLYITNANKLLLGQLPEGREIFYTTYYLLIAGLYSIGLSVKYIFIIHFIFALTALFSLYKLTQKISINNITAFIATLFYVLWFKFQQWNLIIYTDSVFTSLVIISTYVLYISHNKKQYAFAFFLLVATFFTRPTGIGLFVAFAIYFAYQFTQNHQINRTIKIVSYFLLFTCSILALNQVLSPFIDSFMASYRVAEIIYPNIPLLIDAPINFIEPSHQQPLIKLLLLLIQNPVYMFKITLVKGFLFLTHTKPYYSLGHNTFIALFLYPIYFFAIKGYNSTPNSAIKYLLFTFIITQLTIVSLTSENWDGRFLLPVLPFIFVLGAIGVSKQLGIK